MGVKTESRKIASKKIEYPEILSKKIVIDKKYNVIKVQKFAESLLPRKSKTVLFLEKAFKRRLLEDAITKERNKAKMDLVFYKGAL